MTERNERLMHPATRDIAHWLIRHAARRTPEELRDRLEEEWSADLEWRTSVSAQLRLAAGCWWAACVIAREHPRSEVTVPALVARGPMTFTERHTGYLSLTSGTLFLIVGLYAAVFCGLISPLSLEQRSGGGPTTLNARQP